MSTEIRNKEYYEMSAISDELYAKSLKGKRFRKLYPLIIQRENILLAYRQIKKNTGAKTAGMNGQTIDDIAKMTEDELISMIRKRLSSYIAEPICRVYIPKKDGKKRPLGIPNIIERIIQQCMKQVLEPIVEAKFHKHSYGFRPMRNAHHAMGRFQTLINNVKLHYVVDIDIKGFFDNVNHTKLRRQLWNIGIQDKQVLAIISKMLKAEIEQQGITRKGTPQGGVLSPLLANVVLNELDTWVSSQWEDFPTKHKYTGKHKYRALKKTTLKEGYIIRYADDFKILTRTYNEAMKWYNATINFLEKQLKLTVSTEKSGITNIRKKKSEFLGFEIKAVQKNKQKYTARSYICKKSKQIIKDKLKRAVKEVCENPDKIYFLNTRILGMHNYYRIATNVSTDFSEIDYKLKHYMKTQFKAIGKYAKPYNIQQKTYRKFYQATSRTWRIKNVWVYPIGNIKMRIAMNFKPKMTPYTPEGRVLFYKGIGFNIKIELIKIMKQRLYGYSIEYKDNRLSRYVMVQGKCEMTGLFLTAEEVNGHHVIPLQNNGNDKYDNLRIVHEDVHKLIHATRKQTQLKYIKQLNLNQTQIDKVNELRKYVNLRKISNFNN